MPDSVYTSVVLRDRNPIRRKHGGVVQCRAIFSLVGNKADLVNRREVKDTEAKKFATQHGMVFMECSGLTGLNISNLFESVTKHVFFAYHDIFASPDEISSDVIRLTDNTQNNRHKKITRGCKQCKA